MNNNTHTFVGVFGTPEHPTPHNFVYSVGLNPTHGFEVVTLTKAKSDIRNYYRILEEALEKYLLTDKVKVGEVFLLEGFRLKNGDSLRVQFSKVNDVTSASDEYLKQAGSLEQVYQLFYGDSNNRLPGEAGFEVDQFYKVL